MGLEDENSIAEQARQLEEEEARRAMESRRPNPLNEEGLRKDPAVKKALEPRLEDPDREKMLQSYHELKSHHRDLRTGQLLESIGRRVRFDFIRGPPVTGIVTGVDEEYGQTIVQGLAKSEGSTHIIILKNVLHMEVFPV